MADGTGDAFRMEAPRGGAIHGRMHLPREAGRRPVVVLCHGFKGFMDWGFFPALAELLAERGFVAVRFNLPGSGVRPGEDRVADEEAFREATFSGDLQDLLALLKHVTTDLAPERIDPERAGLLGHSRGGGTALLAAARDEWSDRIGALVTWAAVATFDRTNDEEKEMWRRTGQLPVINTRTGQRLAVGIDVLHDLEANSERLDLEAAAGRRRAPWLLVHGSDDETVPPDDADRLHRTAVPPVDRLIIESAGHTFGAVHPFRGPTPQLIAAMNATQSWFRRHLGTTGSPPEG